ncbi:tyrosine-type recombinase/integrase [Cellulosimicrobium cellulans]|nr:tyrosine-type recombinase/integrase [Cellulosimicrobium cellulans]
MVATTRDGYRFEQSNFSTMWVTALRATDIEHARVHDFRHTYASWFIQGGVSLAEIDKSLGHGSPLTTQRYARLADEPPRPCSPRSEATRREGPDPSPSRPPTRAPHTCGWCGEACAGELPCRGSHTPTESPPSGTVSPKPRAPRRDRCRSQTLSTTSCRLGGTAAQRTSCTPGSWTTATSRLRQPGATSGASGAWHETSYAHPYSCTARG